MPQIQIDNTTINYVLTKSDRARNIRLSIHREKGLRITVPRTYRIEEVESFIRQKQRWITKHLQRTLQINEYVRRELDEDESIEFLGKNYPIRIITGARRGISCSMKEDYFEFHISFMIQPDDRQKYIRAVLKKWMRTQAKHIIPFRVSMVNERIGFRFQRISIKDQRTRWGSCSKKGNLNFNYRLLMAPMEIIDYIIVHELVHLKEQNHSHRFWSIVKQFCPQYEEHEAWLKAHEWRLVI